MARSRREHVIGFGPPIPIVPITDFSRLGMTEDQWAEAWSIIGPSVERNMARGGRRGAALPLWMVIAAAYLEGLHHGAALAQERPHD